MDKIEANNFIPPDFVESETNWFYNELGIDDSYFSTETSDVYVDSSHHKMKLESTLLTPS
jgi:glutamate dehydrogenase